MEYTLDDEGSVITVPLQGKLHDGHRRERA